MITNIFKMIDASEWMINISQMMTDATLDNEYSRIMDVSWIMNVFQIMDTSTVPKVQITDALEWIIYAPK